MFHHIKSTLCMMYRARYFWNSQEVWTKQQCQHHSITLERWRQNEAEISIGGLSLCCLGHRIVEKWQPQLGPLAGHTWSRGPLYCGVVAKRGNISTIFVQRAGTAPLKKASIWDVNGNLGTRQNFLTEYLYHFRPAWSWSFQVPYEMFLYGLIPFMTSLMLSDRVLQSKRFPTRDLGNVVQCTNQFCLKK